MAVKFIAGPGHQVNWKAKEKMERGKVPLFSPSSPGSSLGAMAMSARAGICKVHKQIPARAALNTKGR